MVPYVYSIVQSEYCPKRMITSHLLTSAALAPRLALGAALVLCSAVAAHAQAVTVAGEVFVVTVDERGDEVIAPPQDGEAAPGDLLEYRFVYRNGTAQPLADVILTGPIPEWTVYVGGSAWAEAAGQLEVQLLGEEQWAQPPIVRTQTREDGSTAEVVVPPGRYGALRWVMESPLPGDAVTEIRYRVLVRTEVPALPEPAE